MSANCPHALFLRDMPPPDLKRYAIADTGRYGRGLFALTDFEAGEVVEVCPYIVDKSPELSGRFVDYVWDEQGFSVMVFGCGSLFNHSDYPNCAWVYKDDAFCVDDPNEQFLIFFTTRAIMKGEELLVSYGDEYWEDRKKD